jgi:hypothetical protein
MPLEINEIGIQMRVGDDDPGESDSPGRRSKKEKKEKSKRGRGACCDFDREELVEDCVRRVLQSLNRVRER